MEARRAALHRHPCVPRGLLRSSFLLSVEREGHITVDWRSKAGSIRREILGPRRSFVR